MVNSALQNVNVLKKIEESDHDIEVKLVVQEEGSDDSYSYYESNIEDQSKY